MFTWIEQHLDNWLKALIAFGVIIAAIWKFGGRVKRSWRKIMTVLSLAETIEARLKSIETEVKPNGGGSLRDLVQSISERVSFSESTDKLKMDQHSYPLFKADDRGMWTWCNRKFFTEFNAAPDSLINMGWMTFIHHDDRDAVASEWSSSLQQNRDADIDCRFRVGHEYRLYSLKASVVRSGSRLLGLVGSLTPL